MGTSSTRTSDEWIELYNPGTSSINLNGWRLTVDDGQSEVNLVSFGAGDIISAGGFFILARRSGSGACTASSDINIFTDVTENKCFTEPLVNNPNGQTLRLYDPPDTEHPEGSIIDFANNDRANWPAGSTSPTYASMERRRREIEKAGTWLTFGGTPTKHNRDNAFVYGTPGYSNWALTFVPTATHLPPTRVRTPTPKPVGRPIINEYLPRPGFDWNQDGKINVFDEFIEIMNIGPVDINMSGWRLDVVSNQDSPFVLPSVTLKPGQRMVFYGLQTNILLSDAGNTVRLLNSNGQVWDAHTYSIAKQPDKSWCRLPDGTFSWFEDCVPTPGTTNTRAGEVPVAPDEDGLQLPVCKLPDTLPPDFLFAECFGYGSNMWRSMFWDAKGWADQFVPENTSKWNSFVE